MGDSANSPKTPGDRPAAFKDSQSIPPRMAGEGSAPEEDDMSDLTQSDRGPERMLAASRMQILFAAWAFVMRLFHWREPS